MTAYYVYSGATGTGTGASWANAFTALSTAISGTVAGDVFYIASDHVEANSAGFTFGLAGTGTYANPQQFLSVNRAGSVPPVAADLLAGAKINTTGTSANLTVSSAYAYGLLLQNDGASGIIFVNQGNTTCIFDTCTFSSTTGCVSGTTAMKVEWRNCIWKPRGVSATFGVADLRWIGGSVDVSVASPTGTVMAGDSKHVEGVDFSACTSATAICGGAGISTFLGCKLPSGVPLVSSISSAQPFGQIYSAGCDSSNGQYFSEAHSICGDVTTETTIVRTGGASDGTNSFSQKVVTPASFIGYGANPFTLPPIAIWNDTTGSAVNVTVHATSNLASGAFPNNDDIWIEATCFGDASSTKASIVKNSPATILTAHSAYTSDSASWGGSPAGGKFAMTVSVTPQKKGYIYVTVRFAKPSTTFYVDPLIVLS